MVGQEELTKLLRITSERIQLVEQVLEKAPEETEAGPALCDSCGVKALVRASMPFGTLFFCMHHYNKHATALKEKGAKATPLF
jgi:hypothetical protein